MTTTANEEAGAGKRWKPPSPRTIGVSTAALVVAVAGALWIAAPPSSEGTDDAYTAADSTTVAPKVRGLVAEVLVKDNQTVRAGQPLVRIDPEEFDARVAAAGAALADARAQVASAEAALVTLDAEERLASAKVAAAATDIRATTAEAGRADADRRRYEKLVETGAVAKSDAERYAVQAVSAAQAEARAAALLAVAREEALVTSARRAGLIAALETAKANVSKAEAALSLAHQDQRHALILAPIDGVIGNRQVRVGDYVQAGSRMLTLVPSQGLYVTANFKETQTGRMRPGQKAEVKVDATGKTLHGVVESLAPGSGSTFSLLPFEPGTGNFTKIVQRVPVRIHLDAPADAAVLRPGLSVHARVSLDKDRPQS